MFDEGWFFQRLHECVDMIRVPLEEVRDRLDRLLKPAMVELPIFKEDGTEPHICVAVNRVESIRPWQDRNSAGVIRDNTLLIMQTGAHDEGTRIALPYSKVKERLGL